MINKRVFNSVGQENYNQYMIVTKGKEIDNILDSNNPVFEMYKYRDELLNRGVGQDIDVCELEQLLKDDEDNKLKQQLQNLFLDYISNNEFQMIKDILTNNTFGWNINRLIEIHNKHKGYMIFRLLSIQYNDWSK